MRMYRCAFRDFRTQLHRARRYKSLHIETLRLLLAYLENSLSNGMYGSSKDANQANESLNKMAVLICRHTTHIYILRANGHFHLNAYSFVYLLSCKRWACEDHRSCSNRTQAPRWQQNHFIWLKPLSSRSA